MASVQETVPLKSLEELLKWKATTEIAPTVLLEQNNAWTQSINQPRTILCHDMKGGYLADRFIHGSLVDANEPYLFCHWSHIHGFIYFSHNFVTIPPSGWVSAAHRNGVMVFGTLITEWDDGKAIWKALTSDETLLERAASQLVEIANHHNFDGWLVNVENSIEPTDIDHVATFLRKLRSRLTSSDGATSHKQLTIIWYDSITIKGDLKWQNALNDYNMKFFQFADGIFLNYNWKFDDLVASKAAAGSYRQYDVFVGVDCFGRGCHGGGGWNTAEALKVIREHDMSVALFAPGWVLECNDASCFQENQEKFWSLMAPYLPSHRICQKFPLETNFCAGYGKIKFVEGTPLECVPASFSSIVKEIRQNEPTKYRSGCGEELSHWFNLNEQNVQPIWHSNSTAEEDRNNVMRHCFDDAWNGGGCLELCTNSLKGKASWTLFHTSIPLKNTVAVDIILKTSPYSEQAGFNSIEFGLEIHIGQRIIFCCCNGQTHRADSAVDNETVLPSRMECSVPGDCSAWRRYQFHLSTNRTDETSTMDQINFVVQKSNLYEGRAVRFLLGHLRISDGF